MSQSIRIGTVWRDNWGRFARVVRIYAKYITVDVWWNEAGPDDSKQFYWSRRYFETCFHIPAEMPKKRRGKRDNVCLAADAADPLLFELPEVAL
jgi:hypothetical protein